MSVEEFFESPVFECSEYSWSNMLLSQSTKDLEFSISIDQMLYLRAIYTKE